MAKTPPIPFNRADLRQAADIDLAARARRAAERDAFAAAQADNPWNNIPLVVQEIPNSCLYEIFRAEALKAQNAALTLTNLLTHGAPAADQARAIGIDWDSVPVTVQPALKQQLSSMINLHISVQSGLAHTKATLALAAATMSQVDAHFQQGGDSSATPRWHGPDGSLNSGYAATYLERKTEEMRARAEEILATMQSQVSDLADEPGEPDPAKFDPDAH